MDAEGLQKDLFNKNFSEYEQHYDDECSQKYRREFMYDPVFLGIDLQGKQVLEAMCGSGQATGYLLRAGAKVTGLDISDVAIESFKRRWVNVPVVCSSILDSSLASESFDCVFVMGGLHHLPPNVNKAIDEICRVLKKGGHFCFIEPHAGSLPDIFRRFWYKRDRYFAENEAAIDVDALKKANEARFNFVFEKYVGNLAYLFVYNSLIFRLPLKWKPVYTPMLLKIERLIGRIQGKGSSCFVVSRWQKT